MPKERDDAIRISFQSNFTIDPLAAYIWQIANSEDIIVDIQLGQFDQYTQEFLHAGSPLYHFTPEIIFLFLKPNGKNGAEALAKSIQPLIESMQNKSQGRLVVSNFVVPEYPFKLHNHEYNDSFKEGNLSLNKLINDYRNVHLFDLESLAAYFGKERVTDWKLHYLGNIEFSHEFQWYVARKCMTFIRLMKQAPKKCLVLDLDDTLWGGIVGEVGEHGISLNSNDIGSEYVAFQKAILKLKENGVLLAINSKNNPEDALAVLEKHPHMILRPNDFASIKINWNDKASNILEIADELSLGLDSFVFIDDNPIERGWIKNKLPKVLVPELPKDPVNYAPFLEELDVFEVITLTEEDRKRSQMYIHQKKRKELLESSSSLDEYLKSLKIKTTIAPLKIETLQRASQMVMKTNQFNLTTRRYTEGELEFFINNSNYEVYTISVSDIYGDSGITGLSILKYQDNICYIDAYLLSCRILGRRVEDTFLHVLIQVANKKSEKIIGEYIPTKKNGLVKDFYINNGFKIVSERNDVKFFEQYLPSQKPFLCKLHELSIDGLEL